MAATSWERGRCWGGGVGRSESHLIRNLAPPSPYLLHFGGELDTEMVGELLPPEGGTGS